MEFPHRLDALGAIMVRPVHPPADRVGPHLLSGVGFEELEQMGGILDRRIEPHRLRLSGQDHRHPVVDRFENLIHLCRDDRAALDLLAVGSGPRLPQPREPERLPAFQHNIEGLLRPPPLLPLVEPVRHHQTAVLAERNPEGGLGRHGFGPGVDHPVADRGILRPRGDEAPAHLGEVTRPIISHDNHGLRGGDVIMWGPGRRLCRGRQ